MTKFKKKVYPVVKLQAAQETRTKFSKFSYRVYNAVSLMSRRKVRDKQFLCHYL